MSHAHTILDHLHRHAQETPDRLAHKFLKSGEPPDTLTCGHLEARVRTLAACLTGLATPGKRALLLYPAKPGVPCGVPGLPGCRLCRRARGRAQEQPHARPPCTQLLAWTIVRAVAGPDDPAGNFV